MPETISSGNDVFEIYKRIGNFDSEKRRVEFAKLSNEKKASIVRLHYAFELMKRPNLDQNQIDFFSFTISNVSPSFFDPQNTFESARSQSIGETIESKAMGLFPPNEAASILQLNRGDKSQELKLIRQYEGLLSKGMKDRKVMVRSMAIDDRSAIWKVQLAYHLATANLTESQTRVLVNISNLVDSILEAADSLPQAEREMYGNRFENSLFESFSKAETYAIFSEIGIHQPVDDKNLVVENQSVERTRGPSPSEAVQWDCDCRWYCSSGSCSGNVCRRVDYCGPFGTWECTNRCRQSNMEEGEEGDL